MESSQRLMRLQAQLDACAAEWASLSKQIESETDTALLADLRGRHNEAKGRLTALRALMAELKR